MDAMQPNFRTTPLLASRIAIAATTSILALGGCVTRSQPLSGYSSDDVWIAMQAVADSPSYNDWHIVQNDVYANDDTRCIEVYRELKRLYVSPYSDPRKEEEEWRFQIALLQEAETGTPTINFTARQFALPAHVWDEADRYFAQVTALLGPPKILIEVVEEIPVAAPVEVAPVVETVPMVELVPAEATLPVDIDAVAPDAVTPSPTAPAPAAEPAVDPKPARD